MIENIGEKIKELRIKKGLKLAELGSKIDLSAGHLSQIENDKSSPSLVTLVDIARALDVQIRYFFEPEPGKAFVHRAEREKTTIPFREKVHWLPLTPSLNDKSLEVWMVTIQPRTSKEPIAKFSGEYFIYLLSGSIIIFTREEMVELKPGDSIHFDGTQDSSWENIGEMPCQFICSQAASIANH